MPRPLQEASNFKAFSVTLTDSTDGGTAVPAPSTQTFSLFSVAENGALTNILDEEDATATADGDNYIVEYRVDVEDLTDITRVAWQFHVTWAGDIEQWTPVEYAPVRANLVA
jgi:hypothetical protein